MFKHYGVNEGAGLREAEFAHFRHSCWWAGVLLYGNYTYSGMDWLIGETIHSEAYAKPACFSNTYVLWLLECAHEVKVLDRSEVCSA
jgi:hypothetical protein